MRKILLILCILTFTACSSYEQFRYISEEFEVPSKVYKSDFNQTWIAVLEVMTKYNLAVNNQEAGMIKTRWIDNTLELNFADSFGGSNSVKAAKFKLIVNVVKGYKGNREVAKVTVFKRQLVEQDFLQGYKEQPTDGILEKTLLYRIGRIISRDNRIRIIEEKKNKEAEASF